MKLCFVFLFVFSSVCHADDLYSQIHQKINVIRVNNNLSFLKINQKLNSAAQSQSDWMASVGKMEHLREYPFSFEEFKVCNHHPANRMINAGYFKFEELFATEFRNNGVVFFPKPLANENVNEIIAAGRAPGHQAYDTNIIVNGWMKSPGHRKVILSPCFAEVGIGISSVKQGEVYWCVVFANRDFLR